MANNKYSYSTSEDEEFVYEITNEHSVLQPKLQEIVILNDDYTSVEFVITLLMRVFNKSMSDAQSITQFVHNTGEGSCGIYPYDVAELKYTLATNFIKDSGMPLRILLRDIN